MISENFGSKCLVNEMRLLSETCKFATFLKNVKFLLGAWKFPSKKTFNLLLSRYQLWYYETLKHWVSSSWIEYLYFRTIVKPRGLLRSSQWVFSMSNHFFYFLRNGVKGNIFFSFPGEWEIYLSRFPSIFAI